jgi:hypothetical protein
VRTAKPVVRSIPDLLPVLRTQPDSNYFALDHFRLHLEGAMRNHPGHFSQMALDRYREGKLETFDCFYDPKHGIVPDASLREKVWKAYRDRVVEYMGADEFTKEFRGDDRFTEAERGHLYWGGIVWDEEMEAFRRCPRGAA